MALHQITITTAQALTLIDMISEEIRSIKQQLITDDEDDEFVGDMQPLLDALNRISLSKPQPVRIP